MSNQKKRNFQIEAFKHRVVVDPKYADKTWKILEHAIHEIYNHNASGLSFEELYRSPSPSLSLFQLLLLLLWWWWWIDGDFLIYFNLLVIALNLAVAFGFLWPWLVKLLAINM